MEYYINIVIKPDNEMRENVLLNKLYTNLHKALFDLKSNNIGVSFPETKVNLGRLIRIHSSESQLKELMASEWAGELLRYCDCGDIKTTPKDIRHRIVSRWQSNLSESKLRRLIKRKTITKAEIKNYKARMLASQMTDLPFLELESSSNGGNHRRYIQVSELTGKQQIGEFDYFGLSKNATIPWF